MRWKFLALTVGLSIALPATAEIEEIVVTARKRQESLVETPVAVSVFNADSILRIDLRSIEDTSRYTPGFTFAPGAGRQSSAYRPAIRGLTTIRNGIANTSAATTFIDGVYVGGSVQPTELYSLERIEIMRGPQSAQYGRGTYAGAINYVTRMPTATTSGQVVASLAQHDSQSFSAWASGPLTTQLGYFFGGGYRGYGGEYQNIATGELTGDEQQTDLSLRLHWQPRENLSTMLRLGWLGTDDGHFAASLQSSELNNCCERTAEAPRARGYYVGKAPAAPPVELATELLEAAGGSGVELDRRLASLVLDWRIASLRLTSTTGWVDDSIARGFDLSYANYDPLAPFSPGAFTTYEKLEQQDLSQEFRITSDSTQPARWTAGVYGYRGKLRDQSSLRVYVDANDEPIVAPGFAPLSYEQIDNIAVFGSIDADFGRRWTAGIEARWSRDRVSLTNRANDGSGNITGEYENNWNNLTPRFTLSYALADSVNIYSSIAKGAKPGDFNPETDDETYREVNEESVWSYEVGVKGQLGIATYFALALYHSDINNQQLTTLVELDDGRTASLLTNVGETQVNGVEAELAINPTEKLSINLTYSWTDPEFSEYISDEQADLLGSDGSIADNNRLGSVAGNTLPRVSGQTASAIVAYDWPVSAGIEGYGTADWTYESSRYAQEHNLIETGDRSLVNLRSGIRGEGWDFSLWVRNLFDDTTTADIQRYFDRRSGTLPSFPQQGTRPSSSPRGFVIILPPGRQAGATLTLRF